MAADGLGGTDAGFYLESHLIHEALVFQHHALEQEDGLLRGRGAASHLVQLLLSDLDGVFQRLLFLFGVERPLAEYQRRAVQPADLTQHEAGRCGKALIYLHVSISSGGTLPVSARQTSAGAARELLSGCEGIRWVAQKAQADRDEVRLLLPDMQALCRRIFCRSRLTVSLSRGAASLAEFFLSALPEGSAAPEQASFPVFDPCREGIPIPAGVGYAAKGGNLERFGRKFTGQMYVLSNLLTFEYLWSEVRVKGGAYGTGFRVNPSGDLAASSYRDPTPGRTLDTIDGCADAVERLCGADPDLTKYILGAMTDADPLLSARETLAAAETRFLRRTTQEEVAARRRELLGCTAQDLLALCPLLRQIAARNDTCIIAGSQLLTAAADKIDTTEIPC